MPTASATTCAAAGRSPVSKAMSVDARFAQIGEHRRRFRPHPIAAPMAPSTLPSRDTSSGVWPAASSRSSRRDRLRRAAQRLALPSNAGVPTSNCRPRPIAPRRRRRDAPGTRRAVRSSSLRAVAASRRSAGQRMFAALLGRGRGAEQFVGADAGSGTRSPSSSRPSVSVPVLSKATGADAGQPFQGRAALDEHAGARQPAQRRDDAAGVARIKAHGTGHDQHRQCRINRPAERPAERVRRSRCHAAPET